MSNLDEIKKRAYAPYRREALYCVAIGIAIVSVGSVLFYLYDIHNIIPWFPIIFLCYLLIEIFLNYRIAILSYVEQIFNLTAIDEFKLIKIYDAHSLSGKYGESIINSLYSKKLNMGSYKIKAKGSKKIKLRTAISGKKWQIISDNIYLCSADNVKVTYGKITHIIISFDKKDDRFNEFNILK